MAYKPTLADIPYEEASGGYKPTLADIPNESEATGSPAGLPGQAMGAKPSLSSYAQNSDFDPSDQTPGGGYVPHGTYNTPGARVGSELLASMLVPEFNSLRPILAAGARAGTGAGINTATSALNPDNKNSLAKTGAENLGLNALLESMPYVGKAIGWMTQGVRPAAHARDIIEGLGQGSQTLEENGKSLAQDIKNAHAGHESVVKSYLDPITKEHGNENVYSTEKPTPNKKGQLSLLDILRQKPNLPDLNDEHEVGEVYKEFNKNPTFNNTHKLQQELGIRIGKLQKMQYSPELEKKIASLRESRGQLLDGMDHYLQTNDPAAAKNWEKGINYFKEHVLPYRTDSTIRNIVQGKETNPKNIHSLFEYPTEKMDYLTKQNQIGPIEKIVSDLPPSASGKILYSKIGGHHSNQTPERLMTNLEKARNAGYSSHFKPELDDAIEKLGAKIKNRNAFEHVVGGVGGLGAGHAMGLGPQADLELSALTGYLAPRVINKITGFIPGRKASNPLAQYAAHMFKPVARTAGAEGINALGNAEGNQ